MADPRIITKAPGGAEDLLFGQGSVTQNRGGAAVSISKINAETIPFSGDTATANKVSVLQQLNKLRFLASALALSDAATALTAANILGGLLVGSPTLGRNLTTPTATELIAAIDSVSAGDYVDFSVICNTANNLVVVPNTGVTIVGNATVNNASGLFRAVITDTVTPTVVIYRIA